MMSQGYTISTYWVMPIVATTTIPDVDYSDEALTEKANMSNDLGTKPMDCCLFACITKLNTLGRDGKRSTTKIYVLTCA